MGYNPASQITSLTRSNDAYAWTGHYNVNRPYVNNGLNQMTGSGGAYVSSMVYDTADRLFQLGTAGGTTRFVYAGDAMIAEYDATNALKRRYVHGPGVDEPIVWYEGAVLSNRRWLQGDERGSIVSVTDGTGATIALNAYDEYGIPASTNMGRFQYTGQTWLPEAGLYYYKARMYSATLGRFMQTDPIGYGDGMNIYAYVWNDPVILPIR